MPTTIIESSMLVPVTLIFHGEPVNLIGWQISPHLAVTAAIREASPDEGDRRPVFSGRWIVVHRPTGLMIPGGGSYTASACLHHAIEFAHRLAATDIDWNTPRDTLAKDRHARETCQTLGVEFALCTHPAHCADLDDEYPNQDD